MPSNERFRELQAVGVQYGRRAGMGFRGRAEFTVSEPEQILRYQESAYGCMRRVDGMAVKSGWHRRR